MYLSIDMVTGIKCLKAKKKFEQEDSKDDKTMRICGLSTVR